MNTTLKVIAAVALIILLIGGAISATEMFRSRQSTQNENSSDATVSEESREDNINSIENSKGSTGVKTSTTVNTKSQIPSDATLIQLMNSSKIRVPNTAVDVVLVQGTAGFTDSAVKGTVTLNKILGKVITDVGYDVFVEMSISTNGPSVLHYVALFRSVGQGVQYTSSVLIGDRLSLVGITAAADTSVTVAIPKTYMSSTLGYKLVLSYLDRKNGEPITTSPSLLKTMSLRVKNHIVSK